MFPLLAGSTFQERSGMNAMEWTPRLYVYQSIDGTTVPKYKNGCQVFRDVLLGFNCTLSQTAQELRCFPRKWASPMLQTPPLKRGGVYSDAACSNQVFLVHDPRK